jgi:hypothetical protein
MCVIPAEDNMKRFVDDADLSTFVTIVSSNRSRPDTLHHVFSVLHILSGNGVCVCLWVGPGGWELVVVGL